MAKIIHYPTVFREILPFAHPLLVDGILMRELDQVHMTIQEMGIMGLGMEQVLIGQQVK